MFKPKSDPAAASLAPADAVQQARTRARHRLIGAVVLLGIGIVGFPLVFETQPRPIPVDIPIEIPKKDALPPLTAPPALPAASRADAVLSPSATGRDGMTTESRADAGREIAPAIPSALPSASTSSHASVPSPAPPPMQAASSLARAAPPAAATASKVAVAPPAAAASKVATAPPASATSGKVAEAPAAESARARALLEGKPVAAADASRFVVQVGAFADANAARETRLKVEKLGLRTYTQIAQTADGSRIRVRVGPFASRSEAEAALAKAKAAGLAAVVLTL